MFATPTEVGKPAEHRRVVERVADVDVRRQIVAVAAEHLANDRHARAELVEVRRTEVDVHARAHGGEARPCGSAATHVSASSFDSETSSFQSIARSTSRYFESLDSRAPGTFDITSTATSFIRRRHSGRLAAGTPYCLTSLRPSRMNVTPPFSVTHASTGVIFMNAWPKPAGRPVTMMTGMPASPSRSSAS